MVNMLEQRDEGHAEGFVTLGQETSLGPDIAKDQLVVCEASPPATSV
jgi:hypothetical protein